MERTTMQPKLQCHEWLLDTEIRKIHESIGYFGAGGFDQTHRLIPLAECYSRRCEFEEALRYLPAKVPRKTEGPELKASDFDWFHCAYAKCIALSALGRHDEAQAEIRTLEEIHYAPRFPNLLCTLGVAGAAGASCFVGPADQPSPLLADALYLLSHPLVRLNFFCLRQWVAWYLAKGFVLQENPQRAKEILLRHFRTRRFESFSLLYAITFLMAGDLEAARRMVERAHSQRKEWRCVNSMLLHTVAVGVGDERTSLDLLRQSKEYEVGGRIGDMMHTWQETGRIAETVRRELFIAL